MRRKGLYRNMRLLINMAKKRRITVKEAPTMVDRHLGRNLSDVQDRLEELGIGPDDAESFVDDIEESIEKLLASSEADTDSQDEDK
jgi:hypothetical protein